MATILSVVVLMWCCHIVLSFAQVHVDPLLGRDTESCMKTDASTSCRTLAYAAARAGNSTRISLSNGVHLVNQSITIQFFENVTISGVGDRSSVIQCHSDSHTGAGIKVQNGADFTLKDLSIQNCDLLCESTSRRNRSSSYDSIFLVHTAVYVQNTTNVEIDAVKFVNNPAQGLALYDTNGVVIVRNSEFTNNSIPEKNTDMHSGGGGLYIEYTYCTPGRPTNCDYKNNPYSNGSRVTVSDTQFLYNRASVISDSSGISFQEGEYAQRLGSGGGVGITMKGVASLNMLLIVNCTFVGNVADFGGGSNVIFHDAVTDNEVKFSDCYFGLNEGKIGAGGMDQGFLDYSHSKVKNNQVTIERTVFVDNQAYIGGGTGFFSSRIKNNFIIFSNCSWIGNRARIGAAISMIPEVWSLNSDGSLPIPVLMDNTFQDNVVYEDDGVSSNSGGQAGIATLFCSEYTINVSSLAFVGNTGTGLVVEKGIVNILENAELVFYNNTGEQGGALALLSGSTLVMQEGALLNFTQNLALDSGGAIFAFVVDIDTLFVSNACFLKYVDIKLPPEDWPVDIYFKNNTAVNVGNSIFASSILPCYRASILDPSRKHSITNVFRWENFHYHSSKDAYGISSDAGRLLFPANTFSGGVEMFPGENFRIPLVAKDDLSQTTNAVYRATVLSLNDTVEVDDSKVYITDNTVRINGGINSTFNLTLQTSARNIMTRISARLKECPVGYYFEPEDNQCACSANTDKKYNGIISCKEDMLQSVLMSGYWAGCDEGGILYTAECPSGFCPRDADVNATGGLLFLPQTCKELDEFICGPLNRSGILCGQCIENYTVYFHSTTLRCNECSGAFQYVGLILYVITEILPITILFIILIVFDVNLTSGAANGFIFFAQVVTVMSSVLLVKLPHQSGVRTLSAIYYLIYGFLTFEFFDIETFSFCLWKGATSLDNIIFSYISTLYALGLILGLFAVMRLSCANRLLKKFGHRNYQQNSLLHGISIFIVISYTKVTKISFLLLSKITVYSDMASSLGKSVVQVSGVTGYFALGHLPYAIPALVIMSLFTFTVPSVLTFKPLYDMFKRIVSKIHSSAERLFESNARMAQLFVLKTKPVLDNLQGCFKDNMRYFSGFYFFYRMIIAAILAFSTDFTRTLVGLNLTFSLMLCIHAIAQPYAVYKHNVLDALFFTNLLIINSLSLFNVNSHNSTALYIQLVFIYAPLVYVLIYCFWLYLLPKLQKIIKKFHSEEKEDVSTVTENLQIQGFDEDSVPARLFYAELEDDNLM